MAENSKIEWCDATWTIVQGCDYDSPGCIHCYAVRTVWRLMHNPNPKISGPLAGVVEKRADGTLVWTGKVATRTDRMGWPRSWKKPLKIFLPSHGDLFHEAVPDSFIDQCFDEMEFCTWHTFQQLTKRSERQQSYVSGRYGNNPPENIWFGVSVEDRKRMSRIRHLQATPAAVRFISAEPLLEDLGTLDLTGIHQVICGGESGPDKRPTDEAWHRSLRDQCAAAGVAFFEKQIDKVQPIPADLMIRQFPMVAA